jgi:hypothetical protein
VTHNVADKHHAHWRSHAASGYFPSASERVIPQKQLPWGFEDRVDKSRGQSIITREPRWRNRHTQQVEGLCREACWFESSPGQRRGQNFALSFRSQPRRQARETAKTPSSKNRIYSEKCSAEPSPVATLTFTPMLNGQTGRRRAWLRPGIASAMRAFARDATSRT